MIICENCGNECFGIWKYGKVKTCSLNCLRNMIKQGKISKIPADAAFPELGIKAPSKQAEEQKQIAEALAKSAS